jgi:hypothetical protein
MEIDFSGTWHNQHGSEMSLTVDDNGRLAGSFCSAVGTPTPADEFPLTGFVCGDLISFTVNFGTYQSLTAWTGQHTVDDGIEKIETVWHLAVNIEDAVEKPWLWSGIRTGADTCVRGTRSGSAHRRKTAPSHPMGRLIVM